MISNAVLFNGGLIKSFKSGDVAIKASNRSDIQDLLGCIGNDMTVVNEATSLWGVVNGSDESSNKGVYISVNDNTVRITDNAELEYVQLELARVTRVSMSKPVNEAFDQNIIGILCETAVENDLFIGNMNKYYNFKPKGGVAWTGKPILYTHKTGLLKGEIINEGSRNDTILFSTAFNVSCGLARFEKAIEVENKDLWEKFNGSKAIIMLGNNAELRQITLLLGNHTNVVGTSLRLPRSTGKYCYISQRGNCLQFENDIDSIPVDILEHGIFDYKDLLGRDVDIQSKDTQVNSNIEEHENNNTTDKEGRGTLRIKSDMSDSCVDLTEHAEEAKEKYDLYFKAQPNVHKLFNQFKEGRGALKNKSDVYSDLCVDLTERIHVMESEDTALVTVHISKWNTGLTVKAKSYSDTDIKRAVKLAELRVLMNHISDEIEKLD